MKIGILTYFWAENPGTFLQAYSTFMAVKTLFPEDKVEMINVKLRNVYFKPQKDYMFSPKKLSKALLRFYGFKKGLKKIDFSPGKYVGKDTNKALEYIKKQAYDTILVGSDTVFKLYNWNYESDSLPVYYLDDVNARKVMVAASCCSTSIGDLSPKMKKNAHKCLSDFHKMGVRDKNTFDLFYELKGSSEGLEIIPDPTFTYEVKVEKAREVLVKNKFDFKGKSVIIHLPSSFPLLNETVEYFKLMGWNIVAFNYVKYADYCLLLNPEEWAGVPYFVDLVITDRFHGSIFSLRNNTPVIGIDCSHERVSSQNSSKVRALFEEYGIVHNYLNFLDKPSQEQYFNVINNAIKSNIDFTSVNLEMKNRYLNYLRDILD